MSTIPDKILLSTDGSEDANLATRIAVELSTRFDSELHVVHAWHTVASPHFKSFVRSHLKEQAEELLAEGVSRIESSGGKVYGTYLEEGRTVDAVLTCAENMGPGLILLGSRGHGLVERIVMGSVSEGVVRGSPCPVLLARGGDAAWPPERIVLGDDGSEEASAAVDLGAAIGGLYGARGMIVQAFPSLMEVDLDGEEVTARMLDDEGWFKSRERELGARAEEVEGLLGSRPKVRVSSGEPTVCLLSAAEEGGPPESVLIAVGSRGLGAVRRATLGSVSTKLIHAAPGPILIHPHGRR